MSDRIEVPWTWEQVEALNACQRDGWMHPYTCPNRGDGSHQVREERGGDLGALLATPSGWVCSDCNYRQNWAHAFSADPSAKPSSAPTQEAP